MTPIFSSLKTRVNNLKREIVPIYYALLDKRTPLAAKILSTLTIGYLLSPIDLIPDFIPVLGLLDDLIIVPLMILATLKLIPAYIIKEIKAAAENGISLQKKWYYAIPIVILYGYLLFMTLRYLLK